MPFKEGKSGQTHFCEDCERAARGGARCMKHRDAMMDEAIASVALAENLDKDAIWENWKDYYDTFHLDEIGNHLAITYEYWMRVLERQLENAIRNKLK